MMKVTPQLTFLLEVLKTTYKSKGDRQVVYPLLQENREHLNQGLAELLHIWATSRLETAKPATARTLAETVCNFSELMQQFPQGTKQRNLEIAIAGYQAALLFFPEKLDRQEFAKIEAALIATKEQHQQIIEFEALQSDIVQLRQKLAATERSLETITSQVAVSPSPQVDLTPLLETIREIKPRDTLNQSGIILPAKEFNTAILYDIENLTKGYNFTADFISQLSLENIIEQIRARYEFGKIAIQRAYANWSVPQLKQIKNEILSLGIEPIQIFGFGIHTQKNAADIQLTIDAIEFIHKKPSIQLFIIVSGDGAFASVANKLHEYGKTVIGCAYEKSTNSFLEAVCDAFVPIPDPEITLLKETEDYRNRNEQMLAEARSTLKWLDRQEEYSRQLRTEGMYLSQVWKAFHQRMPNISTKKMGFEKWKPCLMLICQGTEFRVIDKTPTEPRLVVQNLVISPVSSDPTTPSNIHSLGKYRKILSSGPPIFRLPPSEDLSQVAACLAQNPLIEENLGEGIAKLTSLLAGSISEQSVKKSLLTLLSAGCFLTEPKGGNLPELSLTLKSELNSQAAILQVVQDTVRKKLLKHMTEIDENVLREVIPLSVSPAIGEG